MSHEESPEDVLKVEEVRKLLRCSARSVQKMAREGTLPHFKIGRHLRFYSAAVREWMQGKAEQ